MSAILTSKAVTNLLTRLYADAAQADPAARAAARAEIEAAGYATAAREYRRFFTLMKNAYLAVNPDLGHLLYILARTRRPTTIVEFGTSFGVSTIFLAAALRDNVHGRLITTEFEPSKVIRARENLAAAGLADLVDLREGDALETLHEGLDRVDFVFLDGAKQLYRAVLQLLRPRLSAGALVAADNASAAEALDGYVTYMRNPDNGYLSIGIPFSDTAEFSLYLR